LLSEADRLDGLLRQAGFEVAGGTMLFRLARHGSAPAAFEHLCRAGLLTRPFRTQPDYLRFGIPHAPVDWQRLQDALLSFAAVGR
jgi:cobalamin biosynthetic protein CobC